MSVEEVKPTAENCTFWLEGWVPIAFLIVLGLLGVLAALVVPSLRN